MLFLKDKDVSTIMNKGIVWRKDMFRFMSMLVADNTYLESFWIKCIENNMNMICISDVPLYTINV